MSATLSARGDRFCCRSLPLRAPRRAWPPATGSTSLRLDTAPRTVDVPDDLAAAGVRVAFDALAPPHRKAHVVSVEEAKSAETRARRTGRTVAALQA